MPYTHEINFTAVLELLDHPGWKELARCLAADLAEMEGAATLRAPLTDSNAAFIINYNLGRKHMLERFAHYPDFIIEVGRALYEEKFQNDAPTSAPQGNRQDESAESPFNKERE